MNKCRKCGFVNSPGTNYCQSFGSYPPKKTLVKVIPLKDGRWYCPECGELNSRQSKICYGCGRDFI